MTIRATRSELCHRIGALDAERKVQMRRQAEMTAEKKALSRAISELDNDPITVTDHAVVRWLERRCGVDIEAIRSEIAGLAVPHIGARGTVAVGAGLVMLIDGTKVVTIMPEGVKPWDMKP